MELRLRPDGQLVSVSVGFGWEGFGIGRRIWCSERTRDSVFLDGSVEVWRSGVLTIVSI